MKSSQYERARVAAKNLKDLADKVAVWRSELQRVLDEAQNAPPEGQSDGTITGPMFGSYCYVVIASNGFIKSIAEDLPWE